MSLGFQYHQQETLGYPNVGIHSMKRRADYTSTEIWMDHVDPMIANIEWTNNVVISPPYECQTEYCMEPASGPYATELIDSYNTFEDFQPDGIYNNIPIPNQDYTNVSGDLINEETINNNYRHYSPPSLSPCIPDMYSKVSTFELPKSTECSHGGTERSPNSQDCDIPLKRQRQRQVSYNLYRK